MWKLLYKKYIYETKTNILILDSIRLFHFARTKHSPIREPVRPRIPSAIRQAIYILE